MNSYQDKKDKAEKYAEKIKQKQELYEIKHKNDKSKEKMPTGKIGFWFLLINCTIIEIYALVAMMVLQDLTPLTALIAAVVGDCIAFISYNIKSGKENTSGGIIYESAMKKLEYELENNSEDAVG